MRIIAMIAVFLMTPLSMANAAETTHFPPPTTVVPLYECMHIDPAIARFTCAYKNGEFYLTWQIDVRQLPIEPRRRAMYEYSKLALHIVEYGNVFHWSSLAFPGKTTTCYRAKTGYIAIACN